MYNGFDVI